MNIFFLPLQTAKVDDSNNAENTTSKGRKISKDQRGLTEEGNHYFQMFDKNLNK